MLTLHRNRWTDSSKKKRKKKKHTEGSQFEICSNDKKDTLCDENDVNPASSQWRWWFFFVFFITLFTKWVDAWDRFGRRNQVFFHPSCLFLDFFWRPQFVSRDLLKMLCLWTGSRDTCGTQLAKSPTKENFLSQTQRRRRWQKYVSGALYSAATWQTMVPVLGLTQASVSK